MFTIFVIAVIFILVVFLFVTSESFNAFKEKCEQLRSRVELATPATLIIKTPNGYEEKKMMYDKIIIAQRNSADISLTDKSCEKRCHAVIQMKYVGGAQKFTIKNCSKSNPIQMLDVKRKDFSAMEYNERTELANNDTFYVGGTKITFVINEMTPSWTVPVPVNSNRGFGEESRVMGCESTQNIAFVDINDRRNEERRGMNMNEEILTAGTKVYQTKKMRETMRQESHNDDFTSNGTMRVDAYKKNEKANIDWMNVNL